MKFKFVVRTVCCGSFACCVASGVNSKRTHKRVEDTNHEQPTSSSVATLLCCCLTHSFLCWGHLVIGASACGKRQQKCFVCPWHLSVNTSCPMCTAEHDVLPVWCTSICNCVWWTASLSYSLTHMQFLYSARVRTLCHILWPEVSVTFCNCSVFCTCILSGSPHNVIQSFSWNHYGRWTHRKLEWTNHVLCAEKL